MTEERNKRFYSLRNDFMFHMVFQKNDEALKGLVAVLMRMDEKDIRECRIENPIKPGMLIDAKSCTLDIMLTLNNERRIDIEMQVQREQGWRKRTLFYWTRLYNDLKSGEDYGNLKESVQIGILNYTPFPDEPQFYSEYKLLNTETNRLFSEDLSIRLLDLTQVDKAIPGRDDELRKWAAMFRADSKEELLEAAGEKEVFRDMAKTMGVVTLSDEYRSLMDGRELYKWQMKGSYEAGKDDGLALGKQEGFAEGIEKGKEEGKEEGAESMLQDLAAALGKDPEELRGYLKDRV